jgi:acetyl-CoA decarbonylase/synthase complex subunit delta
MLSMPIVCNVGFEANRSKEANMSNADAPQWGDLDDRNIMWEAVSASATLQVGASILLMRNPIAVALIKKNIDELMSV